MCYNICGKNCEYREKGGISLKKTFASIIILLVVMLSLSSCSLRMPELEFSIQDGYLVVNGNQTGYEVATEPEVTVVDGYVTINGVKTEYKIDDGREPEIKEDVVTVDVDGYIVVNGVKTEYKLAVNCDHRGELSTVDPTCSAEGYDQIICSSCGMRVKTNITEKLEHVYSTEYSLDDDHHWFKCTGCNEIKDKELHSIEESGYCTVCKVKVAEACEPWFELTENASTATRFAAHTEGDDGFVLLVGNANAVSLDTFFKLIDGKSADGKSIEMIIYDAASADADGVYSEIGTAEGFSAVYEKRFENLENTVKFDGTGDAIIKIKLEGEGFTELRVRVVGGYNVTDQASWEAATGDIVVLDSFAIADYESTETPASSKNVGKNTVYGNMNTITFGKYLIKKASKNHYFIRLGGGTVRDLLIIGPEYDELSMYSEGDSGKFVHAILMASDTSSLINSYVSGFRAPVRVDKGTAVIDGTTLMGGVMANVYVYDATEIKLNNATTIQRPNEHDLVGLGICFDKDTADTILTVTGEFDQHNLVNEKEAEKVAGAMGVNRLLQSTVAYTMLKMTSCVHKMDGADYFHAGVFVSPGVSLSSASTLPENYTDAQAIGSGFSMPGLSGVKLGNFYSADSASETPKLTPEGDLTEYTPEDAAEHFISARYSTNN